MEELEELLSMSKEGDSTKGRPNYWWEKKITEAIKSFRQRNLIESVRKAGDLISSTNRAGIANFVFVDPNKTDQSEEILDSEIPEKLCCTSRNNGPENKNAQCTRKVIAGVEGINAFKNDFKGFVCRKHLAKIVKWVELVEFRYDHDSELKITKINLNNLTKTDKRTILIINQFVNTTLNEENNSALL